MRKPHILILLVILLAAGISCISEFQPPADIEQVRGMVVVDGNISNGETLFHLSRSIGIRDTFSREDYHIRNAHLWVEDNQGGVYEGRHIEDGTYQVSMGDLKEDLEYHLCFTLDGGTYESSPRRPLFTGEIDSLTFTQT